MPTKTRRLLTQAKFEAYGAHADYAPFIYYLRKALLKQIWINLPAGKFVRVNPMLDQALSKSTCKMSGNQVTDHILRNDLLNYVMHHEVGDSLYLSPRLNVLGRLQKTIWRSVDEFVDAFKARGLTPTDYARMTSEDALMLVQRGLAPLQVGDPDRPNRGEFNESLRQKEWTFGY